MMKVRDYESKGRRRRNDVKKNRYAFISISNTKYIMVITKR